MSQGPEGVKDKLRNVTPFTPGAKTGQQEPAADLSPPIETDAEDDERAPFPMDALPGAAGDMAREIGQVTTSQCDSLAAAAVLGTLSASVGAGLEVGTGGERRTRGNLFILAIADSGTGKGEAFSLAAKPFEELEAQELERFDLLVKPRLLAKINVAAQRATMLCKIAAKEDDEHARHGALVAYERAEQELAELRQELETAPRWKVSDVTKEALALVMQGQPGEAVSSMTSEARGVFSIIKGRYGKEGGDEDFYCSGYSGDGVTFDRVTRSRVVLRRPCLSILWMVQPDAARKAFGDETMRESGLLPRFLIFDPKAEAKERFESPQPIPSDIKAGWGALIAELVDTYRQNGSEPQTVSASKEAIAILADYERENVRRRSNNGDLRDLKSFVARWAENAWRMAVVLHAAKHGRRAQAEIIDGVTAENSVKIMRWFCDSQLASLASGRTESLRKRLLALLAVLAEANGEISIRELKRSHSFEREEIDQLAGTFPKSFRVFYKRPETGRPSWVVSSLLEDKKKV
jgi:hypothetical protein